MLSESACGAATDNDEPARGGGGGASRTCAFCWARWWSPAARPHGAGQTGRNGVAGRVRSTHLLRGLNAEPVDCPPSCLVPLKKKKARPVARVVGRGTPEKSTSPKTREATVPGIFEGANHESEARNTRGHHPTGALGNSMAHIESVAAANESAAGTCSESVPYRGSDSKPSLPPPTRLLPPPTEASRRRAAVDVGHDVPSRCHSVRRRDEVTVGQTHRYLVPPPTGERQPLRGSRWAARFKGRQ